MPAFDAFDVWPYPIKLIRGGIAGGYDTNGLPLSPSATTTDIVGHFSPYGREERETQWGSNKTGKTEEADLRFFSYTELRKGDLIERWNDLAGTAPKDRYRIVGIVRSGILIATRLGEPRRYEAALVEAVR